MLGFLGEAVWGGGSGKRDVRPLGGPIVSSTYKAPSDVRTQNQSHILPGASTHLTNLRPSSQRLKQNLQGPESEEEKNRPPSSQRSRNVPNSQRVVAGVKIVMKMGASNFVNVNLPAGKTQRPLFLCKNFISPVPLRTISRYPCASEQKGQLKSLRVSFLPGSVHPYLSRSNDD